MPISRLNRFRGDRCRLAFRQVADDLAAVPLELNVHAALIAGRHAGELLTDDVKDLERGSLVLVGGGVLHELGEARDVREQGCTQDSFTVLPPQRREVDCDIRFRIIDFGKRKGLAIPGDTVGACGPDPDRIPYSAQSESRFCWDADNLYVPSLINDPHALKSSGSASCRRFDIRSDDRSGIIFAA